MGVCVGGGGGVQVIRNCSYCNPSEQGSEYLVKYVRIAVRSGSNIPFKMVGLSTPIHSIQGFVTVLRVSLRACCSSAVLSFILLH